MSKQTPAKRSRASSSQSADIPETNFYNATARKIYEKSLKNKPLLTERVFDFSSFRDPIIDDVIVNNGWESLANLAGPIIPALVKEFYANLHKEVVNYTVRDVSVVKGRRVILLPTLISTVLDIPVVLSPDFSTAEEEFPPIEIVHKYLRSDGKFSEEFSDKLPQRFLGVGARMLNLFVCSNIWPTEHHGELPLLRSQLIYSMLNRKSICVCTLIYHQLLHVQMVIATPIKLAFPVLICRILERAGIPVSGDSYPMRPPITPRTGTRSIKQAPLVNDSDEDFPQPSAEPSSSSSGQADLSPVLTAITSLSSDVKNIANSVSALSQSVQTITTGMSRLEHIVAELAKILPGLREVANMPNDLDSLPNITASIRHLSTSATSLVTSIDDMGATLNVQGQRREAAEIEVQRILKAVRDAQIEQEEVFAKMARSYRNR